jgi:hypothetical protein
LLNDVTIGAGEIAVRIGIVDRTHRRKADTDTPWAACAHHGVTQG